jgi:hypothetical protein
MQKGYHSACCLWITPFLLPASSGFQKQGERMFSFEIKNLRKLEANTLPTS